VIARRPGRKWRSLLAAAGLAGLVAACSGRADVPPQAAALPQETPFSRIADVAQEAVAAGQTPGVVILVGQHGRVLFRQAFGDRMVEPARQSMAPQTIFDLASLTKVVATAPAILQLVDQGRLGLDDPVARYWPEFGQNGKDGITIRQLLTHFSGLRVGMDERRPWSGSEGALAAIAADRPVAPPDARFSYSDIDFIVLGNIVRLVSGLDLDAYCERNIFAPLDMRDTGFNPGPEQRDRIAPSNVIQGELRWGQVQDPIAWRMGGVAGHAGLFSTADDLARFAEMIRGGGTAHGVRILSPQAVQAMITSQGPSGSPVQRGLGWDIRSRYSEDFAAFSPTSFGHTGYTGTSIWFDPALDGYAIILSDRLHPEGRGQVRTLRARVSEIVAGALAPQSAALSVPSSSSTPTLTSKPTPTSTLTSAPILVTTLQASPSAVRTGVDVLEETGFAPLAGLRLGLITNQTGRDASGRRTADVLAHAPNLRLLALFSPEHGLSGTLDEKVASSRDAATGLPVYSLYGDLKRPTASTMAGLDALVFDIQDAGVRYYTYITTLAYAMEAAADAGIKVFVLDRPNPLNAATVQGPVMEPEMRSFAGYFPLPIRHGMTVGEIAGLFNREARIGADLRIVPMQGYSRQAWFDQTGLPWINPSPNLRSLREATLYAGVGVVEGANVSVGRGTETPFEVLGAPWIDGPQLAATLNARGIPGVRFRATEFTPSSSAYRGELCHGVLVELVDRDALDAPELGLEIVSALHRLYGQSFRAQSTAGMVGSRAVLQQILDGADPTVVRAAWLPGLERFIARRQSYLIYR